MRTPKILFKLFLLATVFVACNEEEPAAIDPNLEPGEEVTTPTSAGTFTAKIDGADYTVDITTATMSNGVITIMGKRGTDVVTLRIPSNITPNSVTNPYTLDGAGSTYFGAYNTNTTTLSEATTQSDLHMTFDDAEWTAENSVATILNGVTTIKGVKTAHINTGNTDTNGNPIFADVTQEVKMELQTDQSGSHVFGPVNVAYYNTGVAGGDIFETDVTVDNGNVTLDIDTENKLISGSFNFDGTETYTSTFTPLTGTDTDGDGVFDGVENDLGTDANDPCDPIQPAGYTGYIAANAVWQAGDCDGDGTTNTDELLAGTDPYEGNADTDGDGVSDAQEDVYGTDSTDPCDPAQSEQYMGYNAAETVWQAGDCDGDTISNGDEVTNGTDPYFMDFLTKSFSQGEFTYVPYTDGGTPVRRGLNISTHNVANKKIIGTFSFISASIGEDPTRWYLITDGAFDVTYTTP